MLENGSTDVGHRVPFERRPPRQHLESDGAERKQVASSIDVVTSDLFGSHVADRAQNGAVSSHLRVITFRPIDSDADAPLKWRSPRGHPAAEDHLRDPRNFARPKSSSFGPLPVSMMLAGFRSR